MKIKVKKIWNKSAVNRVRDHRERQSIRKKGQKETGCVVCLDPYSDTPVSVSVSSFLSLTRRQRTNQMSAHFVLLNGLPSGCLLFLFLKYACIYVNSSLLWVRPSSCSLSFTFLQLELKHPHRLVCTSIYRFKCPPIMFHIFIIFFTLRSWHFFLPRSHSSDSVFSYQSEQIKPVVTWETRKGEHKQWGGKHLRTFSGTIE